MRLIDADELKIEITKQIAYFKDKANTTSINQDKIAYCRSASGLELAKSLIDNAPTIKQKVMVIEPDIIEKLADSVVDVISKIDWDKAIEAYKERPHGEWIEDSGNIACSHCHTIWLYRRTDFCPHCGADIREEIDDECLVKKKKNI